MNRIWTFSPLLFIPLLDQLSKVGTDYILNQNFTLGLFPEISLFNKSVVAISFFLIILTATIFLFLLLIPNVWILRWAVNVYLGAMLSNCLDKIVYLGVRDNINLGNGIYLNVADIFQWLALPFIIFALFYYSKEIWNEECLRKSFFSGMKGQIKISTKFSFLIFINLVFVGLFCLAFLNYLHVGTSIYRQFLISYIIFSVAILFSSLGFILIYSQRIVGPIVSLISFVKGKKYLQSNVFKIRKGDPLIELEEIAKIISEVKK